MGFTQFPGRCQLPPMPSCLPLAWLLPNLLRTFLWPHCTSSEALGSLLLTGRPQPPFSPLSAHGSGILFPEGALYSSFIFQGSANKFLPNCPQTKKVHISALKVTGRITDRVCTSVACRHAPHHLLSWASPSAAPGLQLQKPSIHPSSPLLS